MKYEKNDHQSIMAIKQSWDFVPSSSKSLPEEYLEKIKKDKQLMARNQNLNFANDFLDFVRLMQKSQIHKDYSLLDIVTTIVPPIMLNYVQIFKDQSKVKSAITVGLFNDETEQNMFYNRTRLVKFDDFNSGSNLWMVDLIAPEQHINEVIVQLSDWGAQNGYEGKKCKVKRIYKDGRTRFWEFTYKKAVWDAKRKEINNG